MKFLSDINLKHGAHATPEDGMCAMEAVAWYMDEKHTDKPQCVSPTIAAAMRAYNDRLPDERRNAIIKPLLLEVIGTNTALEDEVTRAKISAEYAQKFSNIAATWAAAESATYAAESATWAAAESATYAAESAAAYAAKSAATYGAESAESATYAAESATYAATYAAESAAKSAAEIEALIGQHITDMCKVGR